MRDKPNLLQAKFNIPQAKYQNTRDNPYWTPRKNSLELIELSIINKVSSVGWLSLDFRREKLRTDRAVQYRVRACSYDPACRDVSPSGTDISVRSYGAFHPACRDEILLLALAKYVHFSHATHLFNDFGVFLYLFARKSIALARYLTLLYSTKIKLSKKC